MVFCRPVETLRKYAPAPWIERKSKADYKVRNSVHSIEGRSKIVIPVIGFHNDPGIYKDPERFNPDRMTKEKIKKRHPCSFMPFGIGGWCDRFPQLFGCVLTVHLL